MNNNIENYKKAIDNIQASDELINKTINKANEKVPNKRGNFVLYTIASLSACMAVLLVAINIISLHPEGDNTPPSIVATVDNSDNTIEGYIKNFKSQEELDKKIDELSANYRQYNYSNRNKAFDGIFEDAEMSSMVEDSSGATNSTSSNYSKTNVQVEGVDEADIIKTDGTNIYMFKKGTLYVLDKNLKLVNEKTFEQTYIDGLYITSDRIVVLSSKEADNIDKWTYGGYNTIEVIRVLDKTSLKVTREVSLKGYLRDSRLIGDDFYFITSLSLYSDENVKSYPEYEDSITNNGMKTLNCTDIYYVEKYTGTYYINVCAFNIKDNEEANVESFLGMDTTIYCSLNNMYFVNSNNRYDDSKIEILKMKIDKSKMKMESRATLAGDINDQFSLDEYNGYLRVATTEYLEYDGWFDADDDRKINHLFVLNDKMEVVGKTDDFGADEDIHSVRFIGNVGYVVTFREIDPLFVMDLSDPNNPTIKGELKVPGYSAYLHPYDETHIIGIGYNVESNGYGGVRNTNMKMSMFDVSDLSNPKELYSVDIGKGKYVSSSITYNHKALLYDKERSLIGFPISESGTDGFVIYKIENDGFKKVVSKEKNTKYSMIRKIIYIEDVVYALGSDEITSFDLYTMEKKDEYKFDKIIEDRVYTNVIE